MFSTNKILFQQKEKIEDYTRFSHSHQICLLLFIRATSSFLTRTKLARQPSQIHQELSTRLRYSSDLFQIKNSIHFCNKRNHLSFSPSSNITSSRTVSISWFHISPTVIMDNQKYFFTRDSSERNPEVS